MYKKILLCYDGSNEGRNALKEGAEVAGCMHAETHLLAILRDTEKVHVPESFTEAFFESEQQVAVQILQEGVDWLRARGLQADGHLAFGDPIAHIAHCARGLQVDLIVVGHRSRSRLARWWSNSADTALVEHAPCSILISVVPPGTHASLAGF